MRQKHEKRTRHTCYQASSIFMCRSSTVGGRERIQTAERGDQRGFKGPRTCGKQCRRRSFPFPYASVPHNGSCARIPPILLDTNQPPDHFLIDAIMLLLSRHTSQTESCGSLYLTLSRSFASWSISRLGRWRLIPLIIVWNCSTSGSPSA